MKTSEFLEIMERGRIIKSEGKIHKKMHELSQEALKITMRLNSSYHSPNEVQQLFAELTGKPINESFNLFPPFYTDCGKNISLGENVFINSGCHFQDQGSITIGNNVLIGHNVTITTLNHNEEPKNRGDMIPKPVTIEDNVWIGSDVTIIPGIVVGEGAILAAGSVVTKDVDRRTVVAGVPAKYMRKVKESIS